MRRAGTPETVMLFAGRVVKISDWPVITVRSCVCDDVIGCGGEEGDCHYCALIDPEYPCPGADEVRVRSCGRGG